MGRAALVDQAAKVLGLDLKALGKMTTAQITARLAAVESATQNPTDPLADTLAWLKEAPRYYSRRTGTTHGPDSSPLPHRRR